MDKKKQTSQFSHLSMSYSLLKAYSTFCVLLISKGSTYILALSSASFIHKYIVNKPTPTRVPNRDFPIDVLYLPANI